MVATSAAAAVMTTVLMIPRLVGRLERFGGVAAGEPVTGATAFATGFGFTTSTAVEEDIAERLVADWASRSERLVGCSSVLF